MHCRSRPSAWSDFCISVLLLGPPRRVGLASFTEEIRHDDRLVQEINECPWNVNCQPVGDAQASLKYLSRYVKVGISEGRIVRADDTQVVFRYRKVGSFRQRTMALSPAEFIRRFLQHVLPTGFMKVRYFGFLSPSFSMPIEEVRGRIELAQGFAVRALRDAPAEVSTARATMCCPRCGGRLRWCSAVLPRPLGSRALLRPDAAHTKPRAATAVCASG